MAFPGHIVLAACLTCVVIASQSEVAVPGAGSGRPIQLLRSDGKNIALVPEGLALLRTIESPVHVVSVVGGYHTGKSFLLNKLLGAFPGSGFPLGSSVDPETHGAWLWSMPGIAEGVEHPIIFIDTEGLSSPENTAAYDAKLFATLTLLTSHLVYNSVRNIDQKEIEHLELYARQTQMFSVKATLKSGIVEPQLQLPDLTWVVQDFVLEMRPQETPTQWLDRLLGAQRLGITNGDEGGVERSMHKIFRSTACKTMFIPTLQGRKQITHLDREDVKLTDEYNTDLRDLRAGITHKLRGLEDLAKEGKVELKSGIQLAAYVELLVLALDKGMLGKVPSLWEQFLKDQVHEATSSATAFLDQQSARLKMAHPPEKMKHFLNEFDQMVTHATEVYHQLLIGLQTKEAKLGLKALTDKQQQIRKEAELENRRKIDMYLDSATQGFVDDFDKELHLLEIPMASKVLAEQHELYKELAVQAVSSVTTAYPEEGKKFRSKRIKDLSMITLSYSTKNDRALKQVLEEAKASALKQHMKEMDKVLADKGEHCVTSDELHEMHKRATKGAVDLFRVESGVASGETDATVYLHGTQQRITIQLETIESMNNKCIVKLANRYKEREENLCASNFQKLELPLGSATLKAAAEQELQLRQRSFVQSMERFGATGAMKEVTKLLRQELAEEKQELWSRNARAVENLITRPLRKAKKQLDFESQLYWFSFSFKRRARALAYEKIAETGFSIKFSDFLDEAIENWLTRDEMKMLVDGVWKYTMGILAFTVVLCIIGGVSVLQNQQTRLTHWPTQA